CFAPRLNEVCLNPHHYVTIGAPVAQEVPDSSPPWATIAYYELDQKVGETFHCNTQSIYVDAYTDPNAPKPPHRFCLGELPNPGRSFNVENYRQQIGGGLRLYYIGSRIYLRCMSDSAIFVQSAFFSAVQMCEKGTVWMMTSFEGSIISLFDDDVYADWLHYAVGKGEEVVHRLAKMCTVRISFGKGWGSWDEDEPLITSSPCWLEVRLKRQLRKVDKVLQQMGAPYRLHH
ncbi:MH2 domain containing protein, partial [Asbolus verrucosus]